MDDHTTWKVEPDTHGWTVRREGVSGLTSRHDDHVAAVGEARRLAMGHTPSSVIVHGEDGRVIWSAVYATPSKTAPGKEDALLREEDDGLPAGLREAFIQLDRGSLSS